MKVGRQEIEGVVVVSVAEPVEIDIGNADEFKLSVLAATGEAKALVLDVALVDFFDSAGMSALLSIQKRVAQHGGRLALAGLNRAVDEIFRMVGFDVVFLTYPDTLAAISAMKA